MMEVPFVDLKTQYAGMHTEINQEIDAVLQNADFILGAAVTQFESEFGAWIGAQYAIGVSNGLDALRLGLAALDVTSESEVVLPANTFIATALAVTAVGGKPVLVDCEPVTYNIDVDAVGSVLTRRTRVILPVHLTGQATAMDDLLALAKDDGVQAGDAAATPHGTTH